MATRKKCIVIRTDIGGKSCIVVCIEPGVGGRLVVEGSISGFCNDSIGELGHLTLVLKGEPCACGNFGCIKRYGSKDGIQLIAQKLGIWSLDLSKLPRGSVSEALYADARDGRHAALFGKYVGAALLTFANICSPHMIVVGGGLAGASEFFLPTAKKHLNDHWFERQQQNSRSTRIQIRPSWWDYWGCDNR